jgi:hypothetical protein
MKLECIPTERFNEILDLFLADGWRQTYVYDNMDAWIDYGEVHLQKESETLKFVWDNWSEGEIEGSALILGAIKTE